jgi:hypothetical protein
MAGARFSMLDKSLYSNVFRLSFSYPADGTFPFPCSTPPAGDISQAV